MSRQTLSLDNDWKKIVEEFKNHFSESKVTVEDDRVAYSSGSERLEISKSGEVYGAMPLHQAELRAEEIIFEEDQIEIVSGEHNYIFRR